MSVKQWKPSRDYLKRVRQVVEYANNWTNEYGGEELLSVAEFKQLVLVAETAFECLPDLKYHFHSQVQEAGWLNEKVGKLDAALTQLRLLTEGRST